MNHLDSEQIDLYRQRRLSGADLLAADDHISECEECRAKLSGEAVAKLASIEQGLRSGSVDDHISYKQLQSYIDNNSEPSERSAIESHLQVCDSCRAEVNDLRQFATQLKAPKSRRASASAWIIGGTVAAALVVGIFLTKRSSPQPANALTVSLHDGGSVIGLDRKGNVSAPANLSSADRDAIAAALRQGSLPLSVDDRLQSNRSVLLGGGVQDTQFRVLKPVGSMVLSDEPEFQWQGLSGAKSYRVEVFDSSYAAVLSSPPVSGTSWSPTRPLGRGKLYVWQVTATGGGEPVKAPQPPEPEARFEVVDAVEAAAIDDARASQSHLLLASRYAAAGLCTDAMGEINVLDQANPGSSMLARMRNDLAAHCSEQKSAR